MPDSEETALRRNAPRFAKHLSSLLTRTVTDHPLKCTFIFDRERGRHNALIRFRNAKSVILGNGCRIEVLQRVLVNPEDPNKVTTAEYQYAYGFGEDLDKHWVIRYEYVPERAEFDPEYNYPVGHVHFNGVLEPYKGLDIGGKKLFPDLHCPTRRIALEDFIEHLIIEIRVPTKIAKEEALEILHKSREKYEREKRTKEY